MMTLNLPAGLIEDPAAANQKEALGTSNRLADLAGRIREAEADRERSSLAMAERAIEAGRLLLEAKDACPHGQWLPFLVMADMHERQAQRLMTLARSGLKPDTVSDLGMRAAMELAALRRLPGPSEVLEVSLTYGEGDDAAQGVPGERLAFVWESPAAPGYFHVAGWRDATAGSDTPAEALGTDRPMSGDRPDAIFAVVDLILGSQSVRAEARCIDMIREVEVLRREALATD